MKKLLILIYIMTAGLAAAETQNVTVSLGTMRGHTLYRIGGDVSDNLGNSGTTPWDISQLKFPLNFTFVDIAFHKDLGNMQIDFDMTRNLDSGTGKMEDSDWINQDPLYQSDVPDIYSESKSIAEMIKIQTEVLLLNNKNHLLYGLGYMYQFFDFDVSDLYQTYPTGGAPGPDIINGPIGTYSVVYHVPYARVWYYNNTDKFDYKAGVGVSVFVRGGDVDDHIIRGKKSVGTIENGTAMLYDFAGTYRLSETTALYGTFNYISISTTGTQKQTYYNYVSDDSSLAPYGMDWLDYRVNIDNKIRSDQTSLVVGLVYSF